MTADLSCQLLSKFEDNLNFVHFPQGVLFNQKYPTCALGHKGRFIIFRRGEMGEKMGGLEILAIAKKGVLRKIIVIEGGS